MVVSNHSLIKWKSHLTMFRGPLDLDRIGNRSKETQILLFF